MSDRRRRPLPFVPCGSTTPKVVVDGSPDDHTVLTLSHWPGTPVPPGTEGDSSTDMVFRYLEGAADLHSDARGVSNNHFDQDGLAGVYAFTDPDDGWHRRAQLEGLASAGDFGVAPDRTAARISAAVAALADPDRSPLDLAEGYDERTVQLYECGLALLPGWLDDPHRCRELWADDDAALDAGEAAIASGAVRITEHPEVDLAVVDLPADDRSSGHRFAGRTFAGVHPMALHAATERSSILVIDAVDGRHHLTCRYEGWVQFRSRPIRPRVDLAPLAEELTAADHGVRWRATPPSDLTPELSTDPDGPASSLAPDDLRRRIIRHLTSAPVAWDPYASER